MTRPASERAPGTAVKTPSWLRRRPRSAILVAGLAIAALFIGWRFESDSRQASDRAAEGGTLVETRCGPIEYQEAGAGVPLLVVHGSGGGHDQGMAFAGSLARQGVRVIAMSRFGYLRTPMPSDASAVKQADAHACLLDALGIERAGVLGLSAGAPSALQMAIAHPDRVTALIMIVPIAYKPPTVGGSAAATEPWIDKMLMSVIGSDFVVWTGLHLARDRMIEVVLATPPELLATATPAERARVNAMLDAILPVSGRAAGMRLDTSMSRYPARAPLESVRAPTLIISARDDGYGTFANSAYTASQVAGSRFIGFDRGGHTLVGHNDEVLAAVVSFLAPADGSDLP